MKTIETWALHAYADGELDASGRAEIERLLEEDPASQAELAAWRQQKAALKKAFDGILGEPVPARLLAALNVRARRRYSYLAMAAAGLLFIFIGGIGGWIASDTSRESSSLTFADSALTAHSIYTAEVKHPVEVGAAEAGHLQTWLSKRVGVAFDIPDLSSEGYTLLGGRLLAMNGKPAAQLMYEDHTRSRVTLYLTSYPDHQEQALRVETKGSLVACYWRDGNLGMVVVGDLPENEMMAIARVVYDEFDKKS
jgi:anti-sigma factor RsiW